MERGALAAPRSLLPRKHRNMRYKITGDPGAKTGIFSKKNTQTGVTIKVYRLRKITDGCLVDYEDDGAGPAGPNQGRQSLLRGIACQIQRDGKVFPKFVADDDSMGFVEGPGGFPVAIKVIDAAIIDAMKTFRAQRDERKQEWLSYQDSREAETEVAIRPKKKRRRRKAEVSSD